MLTLPGISIDSNLAFSPDFAETCRQFYSRSAANIDVEHVVNAVFSVLVHDPSTQERPAPEDGEEDHREMSRDEYLVDLADALESWTWILLRLTAKSQTRMGITNDLARIFAVLTDNEIGGLGERIGSFHPYLPNTWTIRMKSHIRLSGRLPCPLFLGRHPKVMVALINE